MLHLKLTLNILLLSFKLLFLQYPQKASYPACLTQGRNILSQRINMKILWLSSSVSKWHKLAVAVEIVGKFNKKLSFIVPKNPYAWNHITLSHWYQYTETRKTEKMRKFCSRVLKMSLIQFWLLSAQQDTPKTCSGNLHIPKGCEASRGCITRQIHASERTWF